MLAVRLSSRRIAKALNPFRKHRPDRRLCVRRKPTGWIRYRGWISRPTVGLEVQMIGFSAFHVRPSVIAPQLKCKTSQGAAAPTRATWQSGAEWLTRRFPIAELYRKTGVGAWLWLATMVLRGINNAGRRLSPRRPSCTGAQKGSVIEACKGRVRTGAVCAIDNHTPRCCRQSTNGDHTATR